MSFSVQARVDDHTLAVTAETAKEAFTKAVEWHVVRRFIDISISDGNKHYSIAEFSSKMALAEIAHTVEAVNLEFAVGAQADKARRKQGSSKPNSFSVRR